MDGTSLLDSLEREWLKLPYAIVRECRSATHTLAGLWNEASGDKATFKRQKLLTAQIGVAPRTYKRHLKTLEKGGEIVKTKKGRPRRTATVKLTTKTQDAFSRTEPQNYGILPSWAAGIVENLHGPGKPGRLPWGSKVLLSVVMARLASIKATAEEEGIDTPTEPGDMEDWVGDVENLLGDLDERFHFPLAKLEAMTGLGRDAIIAAKRDLARHGIINWRGPCGSGDILEPNLDFQVMVNEDGTVELGST